MTLADSPITDPFLTRWAGSFPRSVGWLIGKGPSLRYLRRDMIDGDGPVIAINEAISLVEPLGVELLFSMQKDGCGSLVPGHDCHDRPLRNSMVRPERAVLLVHRQQSEFCMEDYQPRCVFDGRAYGIDNAQNEVSAGIGIRMLRAMGCLRVVLVSFDACTSGNLNVGVGTPAATAPWAEGYPWICRHVLRHFVDEHTFWMEPQPGGSVRWFNHELGAQGLFGSVAGRMGDKAGIQNAK